MRDSVADLESFEWIRPIRRQSSVEPHGIINRSRETQNAEIQEEGSVVDQPRRNQPSSQVLSSLSTTPHIP